MGTFLLVCMTLVLWATASIYLIHPGVEYLRKSRQSDRTGNLLEAWVRLVLGVLLFILGLTWLPLVLSPSQTIVLVISVALLTATPFLWVRTRRNWHRLATGRHREEALLSYGGLLALPATGVLLLLYGM